MAVILIAEDDPMNRDMIRRYLQLAGYQVITATNGEQAVAMAEAELPALILMDLGLPVLSGWDATKQLRMAPETRAIPIIALTAYALVGDREKALAAGCNDYETKPINFSRLQMKIQAFLSASGTERTV
ncbi:MAG TPA: response regulator [Roseiflexaceae bacterium]|jgi:two-component system, cell cycle response regulator DivK